MPDVPLDADGKPIIEHTPGDLVSIVKASLEYLDRIKRDTPNDMDAVEAVALTTRKALDIWISLGMN